VMLQIVVEVDGTGCDVDCSIIFQCVIIRCNVMINIVRFQKFFCFIVKMLCVDFVSILSILGSL